MLTTVEFLIDELIITSPINGITNNLQYTIQEFACRQSTPFSPYQECAFTVLFVVQIILMYFRYRRISNLLKVSLKPLSPPIDTTLQSEKNPLKSTLSTLPVITSTSIKNEYSNFKVGTKYTCFTAYQRSVMNASNVFMLYCIMQKFSL